ncbi:MAG: hypothetical protein IPN57_16215 [Ignavibacteria bacterium]|nr:hypothetical protein [Ignavibacteria bacterium]
MNYSDWNELIANYFFNSNNSSEEVFLFISKNEIIKLGINKLTNLSEDLIWKNYINSLRKGSRTTTKKYLLDNAIEEFNSWKSNKKELPFFISYLVSFILPLTEFTEDFNSNNYYGKLNEFLNSNGFVGENIKSVKEIDILWKELEIWSKDIQNGELGIFKVIEFTGNYKYVGKLFSQCLMPPKVIRKLPELFLKTELVPNTSYPNETFRDILIRFNIGLNDNSIKTLKDNNVIGVTILDIVKRVYFKWNGESNEICIDGDRKIIKRNYFTTRLYSQFKINNNDGIINFSYRIKTSNEFPDDLMFSNERVSYSSNDWSNTLKFQFTESLELKDEYNKWIAKFPKKDIRVFIGANNYQLSSDYWIETDKLNKYDFNYILCINRERVKLIDWCSQFNTGDFIEVDLDGIPNGYSLFKILRPPCSLNGIPELTVFTHKTIEIRGGLKIEGRKYLNIILPEIEIINSDGNESIYIKYDDLLESTPLIKKNESDNVWSLPKNISLNKKFSLNILGENIPSLNYRYEILNNENSYSHLDNNDLIRRNKFGELVGNEEINIIQGVMPESYNFIQQQPYLHLIKPNCTIPFIKKIERNQYNYKKGIGNNLISYITYKKKCSIKDFYDAFKFIYDNSFIDINLEQSRNPMQKYLLLNYYDNLGFIDYDYESDKISVINPQFINLQTISGRKILLIGGKDQSLVENIVIHCNEVKLSIEFIERDTYFKFLPDIITITSYDSLENGFGERNIIELAQKLNIEYQQNVFVPFVLQDFSSNINDYENYVLKNKITDPIDYNWARKIFNFDKLEFEKNESNEFDKEYTLVEYKLNEYTIIYKIWINEKCYTVDRNWGRYLIMNNKRRHNILFDKEKEKIAIPVNLRCQEFYPNQFTYLLTSYLFIKYFVQMIKK